MRQQIMQTTQTTQQTAKRAPRMTLASVRKGRIEEPITCLLYGVEGIGKSTFGADAPDPIFLDGEAGSSELDVARFPVPESWEDVREAVRTLTDEPHEFRTLVVDTLDWLEPLVWAHVCVEHKQRDIEAFGYGKGYVAALDTWRVFIADLERLRREKSMNVILLAHSWIKPFKNPEGDDFDRYEMKLHAKAAGLLKEWPKAVLFANYKTLAIKDEKTKRVRGVSTGARLLYTERTAAYDAKNRYSLPAELPLSWADFEGAARAQQVADPAALVAEVLRKAAEIGGEIEAKAKDAIVRAGSDTQKLAQLNNWINSKLAAKAEAEVQ